MYTTSGSIQFIINSFILFVFFNSLLWVSSLYICCSVQKTNIHQSFKRVVVIVKRKMQKIYFILFSYILSWVKEKERERCLHSISLLFWYFFLLLSLLFFSSSINREDSNHKREEKIILRKKVGLVSSSFSLVFLFIFYPNFFSRLTGSKFINVKLL